MKRDSKEEVMMMKNDESDEYSEAAGVADGERSQVPGHSTSHHADDHAAEEPDCHDDKHRSRQEHVVHIASIMFNRVDSGGCPASVIKR